MSEPFGVAEIKIVQEELRPMLRVTVPNGTTLATTLKLQDVLQEITKGLSGCEACNSGVPIWIGEEPVIRDIVRVDLATMKRI